MTPGMRRAPRIVLALAVLLALFVPIAASRGAGSAAAPAAGSPSFTRDVAPIVQQKCAGCHRTGGIAPFPLETARQISSRASAIAEAVRSRVMPPWPPGPRSPRYVGEESRRLSAGERATILAWARSGGRTDGPALGPLPATPLEVKEGESLLTVEMPTAYRPRAPKGATDDYRCFLLDPKLASDVFVTSSRIEPRAAKVVHHVILFRVSAPEVAEANELDAATPGPGWTCFGGTGLSAGVGSVQEFLNNANWVSAWAPGWGGNRLPAGNGVPLPAGSRIVMQVHYNLLNRRAADRSRALLTVVPATAELTPVQTMLLPAPVELACAKGERGRLCSRSEALSELSRKYGSSAALVPSGLLFLCGRSPANPQPSPLSRCDRRLDGPATILAVAGHMHLLGSSIRLELNPGTPRARVLLDIPRWDFHWQNGYVLAEPLRAQAGDVVRVTCRHDVRRRVRGGEGIPKTPRYILWGEGTTDEMCLGLLQVTRG
jgi:hypothetical protein